MADRLRILTVVGMVVNIIGTMLPWGCRGDFAWYCTPGISLYVIPVVRAEDNGGFAIVLLSFFATALIIRPPAIIKRPALLAGAFATLLMMAALYYAGTWILVGFQERLLGTIGAATPDIGLALIFVGSATLLWAACRSCQIVSSADQA